LSADRATVDGEVRPATDAENALGGAVGGHVHQNGRVRNLFDQPQAERRRRNPEAHILVRDLLGEIRLRDLAGARTVAPGDREQRVHPAIRAAIGIPDESRLAHGAVRGKERRDDVPAAPGRRERDLWIDRGAGAAYGRLRMTTAATIEIQRRAKSLGNLLRLLEFFLAGQEVFVLVIGHAIERSAGGGRPAAHARILRSQDAPGL
jgi:hypothetical protein